MPGLLLGRLRLHTTSLLAPLEGVSDVGFRAVCHGLGAALTFTEMVRASALVRNNAAAWALIDSHDAATPTGLQLLASTPEELTAALQALEAAAASGAAPHLSNLRAIDLNFGCPSPEVLRSGAGPALLHRRSRLRALFRALVRWREGNGLGVLAVGAKLRLGLNAGEARAGVFESACASAAEEGLDWVALHARHAGARSSAPPDWRAFERARRALEGGAGGGPGRPVLIANGDVRSLGERDALLRWGAAEGVMLGRAAMRSPWVFAELLEGEAGGAEAGGALGEGAARAAAGEARVGGIAAGRLPGGDATAGQSPGPPPLPPPPALRWEPPEDGAPQPPVGAWGSGGRWPSPEQVAAATHTWRSWAAVAGGTRDKHRAFHEENWARLRALAGAPGEERALRHMRLRVPRNGHL